MTTGLAMRSSTEPLNFSVKLSPRVAAALADNGPMMFPEGKPSYRAGWKLPALSDADKAQLAKELPRHIAAHKAGLAPATAQEAITLLTKLSLHYWQPDRPEAHFKMILADYVSDLSDVPRDILAAAVDAVRRKNQWFPKIPEILAETTPRVRQRRIELDRMVELSNSVGLPPPETNRPTRYGGLSPERQAEFDRLMEKAKTKLV